MHSYLPFSIARLPRIEFGAGSMTKVPALCAGYGRRVLLVTGGNSFQGSAQFDALVQALQQRDMQWQHCKITGEPSPVLIDELVAQYADANVDVVLGVGGGSVLDGAKAIAGLLRVGHSVMDYLEGVGPELPYTGPAVPFIAVPTTAGTGSEATKNAVLSVQGPEGFKKSFRHDRLVAEYAVVDPDLLASCPPALIAANGMDALTQLLESYVSLRANVMTDALAISGLRAVRDGLLPWYRDPAGAHAARAQMAYAALLSGITLAQVGLGSVHGLASPLGAFYPIGHGVVCGTLVAAATEVNIKTLQARDPDNIALAKYVRLGEVLCQRRHASADAAREALVGLLYDWTEQMQLPRLREYGVTEDGLDHVVTHSRGSSMKTNPIVLTDEEIKSVLQMRL
ncbi:MAG: iron-containing alcohol dehydrogenase [Gammaproteobacteria bacterium]|nr:iron-containing alcohol dehydrogenase [Gammaproteobacteria bacterium]